MKKLGVEIEFTGVERLTVAEAIAKYLDTSVEHYYNTDVDMPYYVYVIKDRTGESWEIHRDRSVKQEAEGVASEERFIDFQYACELVTPPLTPDSLITLFHILDIIKSLGGVCNDSCGLHLHLDIPYYFNDLKNLLRNFVFQQDEIYKYFEVNEKRAEKYCKKYDSVILDESFTTIEELMDYIYANCTEGSFDKHKARYYGLNLHSISVHHTVEFRIFNGSLDKKYVAQIIDWALHFCYSVGDVSDYIPVLGQVLTRVMTENS